MDPELEEYLLKNKISYKIYEHPAIFRVAESEKLTRNIPGLRSKNLFLKDEKNNFYLVSMPGQKRLNTKKLKEHLNVKELEFASPEELKKELNITPGSVSIFCMIYAKSFIQLIIDKEIYYAKESGFHPNINTSTLVLDNKNLKKLIESLDCKKEVIDLG